MISVFNLLWKCQIDAERNDIRMAADFCPELSYSSDWWAKQYPIVVNIWEFVEYILYTWYRTYLHPTYGTAYVPTYSFAYVGRRQPQFRSRNTNAKNRHPPIGNTNIGNTNRQ